MKIISFEGNGEFNRELNDLEADYEIKAMASIGDVMVAVFDREKPYQTVKADVETFAILKDAVGENFKLKVQYWALYSDGRSRGLVFDEEMGLIDPEEWHHDGFIKYEEAN